MKRLLILFCGVVLFSCHTSTDNPLEQTKSYMLLQVDSMNYHIKAMDESIASNKPRTIIQAHFSSARKHYKRIESLSEYYFPVMSEFINGPALDESEEYDDKTIDATGFQVIEEY